MVSEEMRLLGYEDYLARGVPRAAAQGDAAPAKRRAVQLTEVAVLGADGTLLNSFGPEDTVRLRVRLLANEPTENLSVSFLVRDENGCDVCGTTTFDERRQLPSLAPGQSVEANFSFPAALKQGRYRLTVSCNSVSRPDYSDNLLLHQIDDAAQFTVGYSQARPVHYQFRLPVAIWFERAD